MRRAACAIVGTLPVHQAAAAVVVAQPGVDVDVDVEEMSELYEEGDTLLDMSETSEMSEVSEKTELQLSEQAKEEGDVASRVSSGAYYDKHTKIYMPVSSGLKLLLSYPPPIPGGRLCSQGDRLVTLGQASPHRSIRLRPVDSRPQ